MPVITCVEDLRALYKRRVPTMFYEYTDCGSWTESTYHDNTNAFSKIKLRQRVLRDIGNRNLSSTMVGQAVSMPVALAPVGLTGMQRANGEILAAKAAAKFGVPYTLSTMSICSIEDVAENVTHPFWFQLYVMRDREFVARLIDRAKAAECSALVLTLDMPLQGQRHKDIKNGLSTPPKMTLKNMLNIAAHPSWAMKMLRTSRRDFGNVIGHVKGINDTSSLSEWIASQFDPELNWDDVKWIKEHWGGKLILKGILDPEDARQAALSGADALIVSNHGGRQLDGAPASIHALPAIIDAVGSDIEVLLDSGIRTGQDIFKALALGATGVFIGRAYIYGLGALGEPGVYKTLELLADELEFTMALCGLKDVNAIGPDVLWQPNS